MNTRVETILKTKSVEQIIADLKTGKQWLNVAAVAAFVASAFFVVKYFAGGEMNPAAWNWEQWFNAVVIGLSITAVITAMQLMLYRSGYKGTAAILATFIVVFFGVFSEVAQFMERGDAIVKHRSENSAVYRAAVENIKSPVATVATVDTSALSRASALVAKYEQELANKNACPRCAGFDSFADIRTNLANARAKEAAARAAVDAAAQSSALAAGAAKTAAITQAKELEFDERQQYAIVRLISSWLEVSSGFANFIFALIIIGTFEYAFFWVGQYVHDHSEALQRVTQQASRVDKVKFKVDPDADLSASKPVDKVSSGVYTSPDGVKIPDHVLKAVWSAMYHGHITTASVNEKGQVAELVKSNGYCGKSSVEVRPYVEAIMMGLSDPAIGVVTKNDKAGLPKYTINNPIPSPSMGGQPRRHNHPPPIADDDGLAVA